jgi:PTH1 family peptidyl-tRNA hydrolase
MTCIGRSDFIRLKVGIGRPVNDSDQEDIINYVLGEMKTDETKLLLALLPRTAEALECLLSSGLENAMNNYNRSFTPPQNG